MYILIHRIFDQYQQSLIGIYAPYGNADQNIQFLHLDTFLKYCRLVILLLPPSLEFSSLLDKVQIN